MQKKKIIFLIISSCISSFIFAQLTNGLKAHYTFSGNINDISGQNNQGVLIGNPTPTSDRFGYANCAYQFPGNSTNYIKVNYSTDFDIPPEGQFSISLWYQGGSPNISDLEGLFRKTHVPKINPWDAEDYSLDLFDGNHPSFSALWDFSPVVDSTWYHLVGRYSDGILWLHKNDTLRDTNPQLTNFPITQSLGDVTIGYNYMGKIDDIRFYNRFLTTTEIHDIFVLPSSCEVTSIKEIENKNITTIYPNPSKNIVNIESNHFINSITVTNIIGQIIETKIIESYKGLVDLSKFNDGLYYIHIKGDKLNEVKIIQKQN